MLKFLKNLFNRNGVATESLREVVTSIKSGHRYDIALSDDDRTVVIKMTINSHNLLDDLYKRLVNTPINTTIVNYGWVNIDLPRYISKSSFEDIEMFNTLQYLKELFISWSSRFNIDEKVHDRLYNLISAYIVFTEQCVGYKPLQKKIVKTLFIKSYTNDMTDDLKAYLFRDKDSFYDVSSKIKPLMLMPTGKFVNTENDQYLNTDEIADCLVDNDIVSQYIIDSFTVSETINVVVNDDVDGKRYSIWSICPLTKDQ